MEKIFLADLTAWTIGGILIVSIAAWISNVIRDARNKRKVFETTLRINDRIRYYLNDQINYGYVVDIDRSEKKVVISSCKNDYKDCIELTYKQLLSC